MRPSSQADVLTDAGQVVAALLQHHDGARQPGHRPHLRVNASVESPKSAIGSRWYVSTPSETTMTAGSRRVDGVDGVSERAEVVIVVDVGRQGQVEGGAGASSCSCLLRVAREVGIGPVGVAVQ